MAAPARHARKRATPAAAAKNRQAAQAARTPARRGRKPATRTITPGGRPMGPAPARRREVTPGQIARAPGQGAALVTQRKAYTARHMLTAELLIGVLIVAIRAVADYEPQADGTIKGKVGHPKGQYGPLPVLAGLIVVFFLLSFVAASGGLKGKLAVIAGAIIDLGLLMNSSAEFEKVTATFGDFGKAKVPPGDWQTTGNPAGEPISGTLPGGSPPNLDPKNPTGKGGFTPPPGSIPVPKGGCPSGYIEEGDPKTGAKWCAPTMG